MNIILSLAATEQISNSLKNNQTTLAESEISKMISNLEKFLQDIEFYASQGFTPYTKSLKNEALNVLHDLYLTVVSTSQQSEIHKRIAEVSEKIISVKATIESAPVYKKSEVRQHEVTPIAFFCDLDSPDHNGFVYSKLLQALKQQIPFVTTRSLLRATARENVMPWSYIEHEKLLLKEKNNWDIYQRGEMLVFIPRSIHPEKSPQEKLQALDFQIDDNLKLISVHEALQGAQKECDIEDFVDLFVTTPKANKLFFFVGHGNADFVGSLKLNNYKKLLVFLKNQHCKGLIISSCLSGGLPSLTNIPDCPEKMSFLEQEKSHPFPTLVLSVGDFEVFNQQVGEEDLKGLLLSFAAFAGNAIDPTYDQLKRKMDGIIGDKRKAINNAMKLYPAHSAGISMGFYPLDECKKGFSIKHSSVKRAELLNHEPFITKAKKGKGKEKANDDIVIEPTIRVSNAVHVEVNPLVVSVPIKFSQSNPILLSMMPGKGHHFIHSIHLAEKSPENPKTFIKKTVDFHQGETYAQHGFFIGEIEDQNNSLKDVVLYLHRDGSFCLWREGEKCYMSRNKEESKEIPPLFYELYCYEIQQATRPQEKAVRILSAGQEREDDFEDKMVPQFLSSRFHSLFNETKQPILCITDILEAIQNKTLQEKEAVVLFFLNRKDVATAYKVFQSETMNPNVKDFKGNSLLHLVIEAHAVEFLEYLLQINVDVDVVNALGTPVLTKAVAILTDLYEQNAAQVDKEKIAQAEKVLELLLNHPKIDLEAKNRSGWTPLVAALPHRHLVKKLVDKGANINPVNKENCSALASFARWNETESVKLLLEFKAKLERGKSSPLTEAIKQNNIPMIDRLLEAGANPFAADSSGSSPFIEAILRASPAVVKRLMEHKDCDLTVQGSSSPLLAALVIGNDEKIHMLLDTKMHLPLPEGDRDYYETIFERLLSSHDDFMFRKMLEDNQHESFQTSLSSFLYKNHFSFWEELVQDKKIIPAASLQAVLRNGPEKKQEIIQWLIHSVLIDLNERWEWGSTTLFGCLVKDGDKALIQDALNHGAKVNVDDPKLFSPLSNCYLYSKAGQEIFKLLIEAGGDLNALDRNKETPFYKAVRTRDKDLVQYCLSQGAKVNFHHVKAYSPLRNITSNNFNVEIFKLLVEAGADLNEVGSDNKTPFCDVITVGDMKLIKYCLEKGAKILPETANAIPPLAVAAHLNNDPSGEILEFLLENYSS